MRRAPRRDSNEGDIIEALRKVGARVYQLDWTIDLLVRFRRTWWLFEVKRPDGKLRISQTDMIAELDDGAVHVVRSVDEALRAIGATNG